MNSEQTLQEFGDSIVIQIANYFEGDAVDIANFINQLERELMRTIFKERPDVFHKIMYERLRRVEKELSMANLSSKEPLGQ